MEISSKKFKYLISEMIFGKVILFLLLFVNYEKFTDNLSQFVKDLKSEKIQPKYRKGRKNEQDAVGFINRENKKFVIFDRDIIKYINGWVIDETQYEEFINNNNIM